MQVNGSSSRTRTAIRSTCGRCALRRHEQPRHGKSSGASDGVPHTFGRLEHGRYVFDAQEALAHEIICRAPDLVEIVGPSAVALGNRQPAVSVRAALLFGTGKRL